MKDLQAGWPLWAPFTVMSSEFVLLSLGPPSSLWKKDYFPLSAYMLRKLWKELDQKEINCRKKKQTKDNQKKNQTKQNKKNQNETFKI